jgi:hypothetical protein
MPNAYQIRKAKRITEMLLAAEHTLTRHQLARAVAICGFDEWRSISFAAGMPVADIECKAAVLAMLRERAPHALRSSHVSRDAEHARV